MASHFNFTFNTHNIQDTMCQICFPDHSSLIRRSTLLLLTPSLSSISLAPLLLFIRSESIHLKMSDHRHMHSTCKTPIPLSPVQHNGEANLVIHYPIQPRTSSRELIQTLHYYPLTTFLPSSSVIETSVLQRQFISKVSLIFE